MDGEIVDNFHFFVYTVLYCLIIFLNEQVLFVYGEKSNGDILMGENTKISVAQNKVTLNFPYDAIQAS